MIKKIATLFIFIFTFNTCLYAKEKIELTNKEAGTYVFKINVKKYGDKIKPYVAKELTTPRRVYNDKDFDFVVNGGFFDLKNKKSVSFVKIDNQMICDIKNNITLMENTKKENRQEKILSRTELRILENKRKHLKFDIAMHNAPVEKGYTIKHSLQAGPMLTPTMDLVQEGFVEYQDGMVKSQSADVLKRRERTAIGLKGKYLYIIVFTKENRKDINELKDYIQKELKLKKAMAFDGGLSTAFNYKNIQEGSIGRYQRKVKSFLIIER